MASVNDKAQPRYTVEIDEEGFPVFSGLRVDDEGLLRGMFGSLKRQNPQDMRSSLITLCENEICYVDAFSTPLVAQSVEKVNAESSVWNFLGGRKEKVLHRDLREDEWGRIHTWIGSDKISASLRSKAQAELLHSLEEKDLDQLKIPPLRVAENDVNAQIFWDQCYRDKSDGWEMGGPTPVLTTHFTELKLKFGGDANVLVPGCGRGHDAAFLAERGLQTTGLDFSSEGISEAQKLYGQLKNLNFLKDDVFRYLAEHKKAFDGIFEHTIFCAIDPTRRREFIAAIAGALRPGGLWFGVFFLRTSPGGPPFGLTQWELRELTKEHFDIFDWKVSPHSATPRKNQELWAVFRRKPL